LEKSVSLDEGSVAATGRVSVRVFPGSAKPRVEEQANGKYRVYVSAQPERGKANAAMIKALARHLGVSKGRITIVKGFNNRDKEVEIDQE
jgi:hypothetical protein